MPEYNIGTLVYDIGINTKLLRENFDQLTNNISNSLQFIGFDVGAKLGNEVVGRMVEGIVKAPVGGLRRAGDAVGTQVGKAAGATLHNEMFAELIKSGIPLSVATKMSKQMQEYGEQAGKAGFGRVFENATGGIQKVGEGIAQFAGEMVGSVVREVVAKGLDFVVSSRIGLIKETIFSTIENAIKGVSLYAAEERTLAQTASLWRVNNAQMGEDGKLRMSRDAISESKAENMVLQLASETARTRDDIAKLYLLLSRTGFSQEEILGRGSDTRNSMLRNVTYFSEAGGIDDFTYVVKAIAGLKSVFGDTSTKDITSGLLALQSSTLNTLASFQYAFLDAAPAAAQYGLDFNKDLVPTLSLMFKQMTPEVAGTWFKYLVQGIYQPNATSAPLVAQVSDSLAALRTEDDRFGNPEGVDVRFRDTQGRGVGLYEGLSTPGGFLETLSQFDDAVNKMLADPNSKYWGAKFSKDIYLSGADEYSTLDAASKRRYQERVIKQMLGGDETAINAWRSLNTIKESQRRLTQNTLGKYGLEYDSAEGKDVQEILTTVKYSGLAGAFEQVSSSLENFSVEIGKTLAPGITAAVNFLKDVVNDVVGRFSFFSRGLEDLSNKLITMFGDRNSALRKTLVEEAEKTLATIFERLSKWGMAIAESIDTPEEIRAALTRFRDLFTSFANILEKIVAGLQKIGAMPIFNNNAPTEAEIKQRLQQDPNSNFWREGGNYVGASGWGWYRDTPMGTAAIAATSGLALKSAGSGRLWNAGILAGLAGIGLIAPNYEEESIPVDEGLAAYLQSDQSKISKEEARRRGLDYNKGYRKFEKFGATFYADREGKETFMLNPYMQKELVRPGTDGAAILAARDFKQATESLAQLIGEGKSNAKTFLMLDPNKNSSTMPLRRSLNGELTENWYTFSGIVNGLQDGDKLTAEQVRALGLLNQEGRAGLGAMGVKGVEKTEEDGETVYKLQKEKLPTDPDQRERFLQERAIAEFIKDPGHLDVMARDRLLGESELKILRDLVNSGQNSTNIVSTLKTMYPEVSSQILSASVLQDDRWRAAPLNEAVAKQLGFTYKGTKDYAVDPAYLNSTNFTMRGMDDNTLRLLTAVMSGDFGGDATAYIDSIIKKGVYEKDPSAGRAKEDLKVLQEIKDILKEGLLKDADGKPVDMIADRATIENALIQANKYPSAQVGEQLNRILLQETFRYQGIAGQLQQGAISGTLTESGLRDAISSSTASLGETDKAQFGDLIIKPLKEEYNRLEKRVQDIRNKYIYEEDPAAKESQLKEMQSLVAESDRIFNLADLVSVETGGSMFKAGNAKEVLEEIKDTIKLINQERSKALNLLREQVNLQLKTLDLERQLYAQRTALNGELNQSLGEYFSLVSEVQNNLVNNDMALRELTLRREGEQIQEMGFAERVIDTERPQFKRLQEQQDALLDMIEVSLKSQEKLYTEIFEEKFANLVEKNIQGATKTLGGATEGIQNVSQGSQILAPLSQFSKSFQDSFTQLTQQLQTLVIMSAESGNMGIDLSQPIEALRGALKSLPDLMNEVLGQFIQQFRLQVQSFILENKKQFNSLVEKMYESADRGRPGVEIEWEKAKADIESSKLQTELKINNLNLELIKLRQQREALGIAKSFSKEDLFIDQRIGENEFQAEMARLQTVYEGINAAIEQTQMLVSALLDASKQFKDSTKRFQSAIDNFMGFETSQQLTDIAEEIRDMRKEMNSSAANSGAIQSIKADFEKTKAAILQQLQQYPEIATEGQRQGIMQAMSQIEANFKKGLEVEVKKAELLKQQAKSAEEMRLSLNQIERQKTLDRNYVDRFRLYSDNVYTAEEDYARQIGEYGTKPAERESRTRLLMVQRARTEYEGIIREIELEAQQAEARKEVEKARTRYDLVTQQTPDNKEEISKAAIQLQESEDNLRTIEESLYRSKEETRINLESTARDLKKVKNVVLEVFTEIGQGITGTISNFFEAIIDGSKNAVDIIKDLPKTIAKMVVRRYVDEFIAPLFSPRTAEKSEVTPLSNVRQQALPFVMNNGEGGSQLDASLKDLTDVLKSLREAADEYYRSGSEKAFGKLSATTGLNGDALFDKLKQMGFELFSSEGNLEKFSKYGSLMYGNEEQRGLLMAMASLTVQNEQLKVLQQILNTLEKSNKTGGNGGNSGNGGTGGTGSNGGLPGNRVETEEEVRRKDTECKKKGAGWYYDRNKKTCVLKNSQNPQPPQNPVETGTPNEPPDKNSDDWWKWALGGAGLSGVVGGTLYLNNKKKGNPPNDDKNDDDDDDRGGGGSPQPKPDTPPATEKPFPIPVKLPETPPQDVTKKNNIVPTGRKVGTPQTTSPAFKFNPDIYAESQLIADGGFSGRPMSVFNVLFAAMNNGYSVEQTSEELQRQLGVDAQTAAYIMRAANQKAKPKPKPVQPPKPPVAPQPTVFEQVVKGYQDNVAPTVQKINETGKQFHQQWQPKLEEHKEKQSNFLNGAGQLLTPVMKGLEFLQKLTGAGRFSKGGTVPVMLRGGEMIAHPSQYGVSQGVFSAVVDHVNKGGKLRGMAEGGTNTANTTGDLFTPGLKDLIGGGFTALSMGLPWLMEVLRGSNNSYQKLAEALGVPDYNVAYAEGFLERTNDRELREIWGKPLKKVGAMSKGGILHAGFGLPMIAQGIDSVKGVLGGLKTAAPAQQGQGGMFAGMTWQDWVGSLSFLATLLYGTFAPSQKVNSDYYFAEGGTIPTFLRGGEMVVPPAITEFLGADTIAGLNTGRIRVLDQLGHGSKVPGYSTWDNYLTHLPPGSGVIVPEHGAQERFTEIMSSLKKGELNFSSGGVVGAKPLGSPLPKTYKPQIGVGGVTPSSQVKDMNITANLSHEYKTTAIAGTNYVTEEQFRAGLEMAAMKGASLVTDQLRNNSSTRRYVGIG